MESERFTECYVKYKRYVVRIAYEYTRDHEAAEDISQTVFLSFYQNIHAILPDSEKAWLFRCTKNASVDYIRKVCRKPEAWTDMDLFRVDDTQMPGTIEALERYMDERNLIVRIMERLKETNLIWYETMRLLYIEELTYEEAAERLGVNAGVLRARVYRARMFLRENFREEYWR